MYGEIKPVVSEECLVSSNQKIEGAPGVYLLRLKNPFIASSYRPGQFVMIKAGWSSLLSRPFSIFNKAAEDEFEILYRVYGKSTETLSALGKGDLLSVTGPLGNGFKIDDKSPLHVLIAGGIGIAPIYSLLKRLKGENIVYYGARTADELYFGESLTGAGAGEVYFATDDGTKGFNGNIVELLSGRLKRYAGASFYSCGPKPMLKELFSELEGNSLSGSLQLSLEENFGCGIGVCLGCVVKCRDDSGSFAFKRVCKDGPVFFANDLYEFDKPSEPLPISHPTKKEPPEPAKKINLSVKLAGLALDYPVMPASGTFGYGEEFADIIDYSRFGALVSKGISLNPSRGNEMPRISEAGCGLINSIGLQNVGLEEFLKEKLPKMAGFGKPVIVNFFGNSTLDYVTLASRLAGVPGISALEANISCPNVKEGGRSFGSNPEIIYELVSSVKETLHGKIPLIVKLTPMVSEIGLIAEVCEKAGADIISLINTIPSAGVDIKTGRFKLGNGSGGLSGPAVKPVAIKLVAEVYNSVRIPIIGMGGISCFEDAAEFFLAGASAVAVGTYSFINPGIIPEISSGLEEYLRGKGFSDIKEIIGLANRNN